MYYDRSAKDKQELANDEDIMIRKPGESTLQQSCIKMDRNRSYEVLVDNKIYRRNRIDIKPI